MPQTFSGALRFGWREKPYDMGVNRWGAPFNEAAMKLDGMDLPPEAVDVLRALFEDIAAFAREAGNRHGQ